ncbi:MAG: ABC transporter ATP-binding protein [Deltaproteobacteria bacterium]|nr:MAG: ABC transporter ATP-binding protein [Deltaproteobacteria bacterium]
MSASCKNVVKKFGSVRAVDGVDLEIPSGSVFGLVGPNGAGKTTLFSIMAGFIRPDSGSVTVLGEKPGKLPPGRLSVLPQDARLAKGIPVGRQLELMARLQGFPKRKARDEVLRVLELCDMRNYAAAAPETLSHGMAKRVAIAQAFIGNPEFVLLDEPLAGLDPAQARRIRLLVKREAGKRTFVISSHVMADVEALCTHVAIIKAGRITAQPSVDQLTRREEVVVVRLSRRPEQSTRDAFAGLPYVLEARIVPEEKQLVLNVQPGEMNQDEIITDIITRLSELGLSFVGLQKGTSLEEAVLAEIGKDGG